MKLGEYKVTDELLEKYENLLRQGLWGFGQASIYFRY
jgi:hypothetical protein